MAEIVMPRLSDTMEEGTILRWIKRDGEQVNRGDELVEIETDKATMSYESDQTGVLRTLAGEGDTLAVGAVIARVGDEPSETSDGDAASAAAASSSTVDRGPAPEPVGSSGEAGAGAPSPQVRPAEPSSAQTRIKASPLARRLARESDVDLRTLAGSGPGGRIVRADVQAAGAGIQAGDRQDNAGAAQATGGAGADVSTAKGRSTTVELSRSQQTIARRMAESKATIPEFALLIDVDMQECVKLRTELKGLAQPEAPTYNDMVVKACALTLREQPRANWSYRDARLQLHSRVNVGVAVAGTSHEEGSAIAGGATLIVPTVFDADVKSLGEIARETRALAARVRDGSITPPELGGGTFTVSNLGMFAVKSFSAIINPPQAAILSVGTVEPRAVVREGEILARQTMTLTLACDHRVLYGADAAVFLGRIRELLEQPAALTL